MATSGSTDFSQTRNQLIEDALSAAGVLGDEETVSSPMLAKANRVLNRLTKHIENDMIHLWKRSECTLFLQQDQEEYTLGGSAGDHCTESFVQNTLTEDRIAGHSKLHVDSLTGITVGDHVGTANDDGALEWTTVTSLNNTGTKIYTIVLGSALTVAVTIGATITDTTTGNTGTMSEGAAVGDTTIYVSTANTWAESDVLTIPGNSSNSIIDLSFNTLTITTALVNAASEGNTVYTYTTKVSKPIEIFNARRRTVSDAYDLPMQELAYKDYMNMPNKETSGGATIQYTFNRLKDTMKVYVWQRPSNVNFNMKITYAPSIQDFDSATDSPDFPQEWYQYLVLATAVQLAPVYGMLSNERFSQLKVLRDEAKAEVMAFDNEETYLKIEVDTQGT